MRLRRENEPEQALADGDPLEVCDRIIASTRAKANNNEWRARAYTLTVATTTAGIPVFIIISTNWLDFVFGKVVPGLLAALATLVAGLMFVERPHERWKLYRGYQRTFETERLMYQNQAGEYSGNDRQQRFVERLAALQLRLHDDWAELVPRSSEVAANARVSGHG